MWGKTLLLDYAKGLEVSCSDTAQQYKARYRHTLKTNYLK